MGCALLYTNLDNQCEVFVPLCSGAHVSFNSRRENQTYALKLLPNGFPPEECRYLKSDWQLHWDKMISVTQ